VESFADLPDALVRDLLAKALPVANAVSARIASFRESTPTLRANAVQQGLVCQKADLDVPREPSVVGIDGSYQLHHLTAVDLCAAAAVAVEGTSKEAKRFWPEPYHEMWVDSVPHEVDTVGVLRGMMISMELDLARVAPHDLVLLDGSFSSLVIYLNQGLQNLASCGALLCQEFLRRWRQGLLNHLLSLLRSDRTVAIPKFTSRNELLSLIGTGVAFEADGKTLATFILNPGEYTRPLPILGPTESYHLLRSTEVGGESFQLADDSAIASLNSALRELRVVYYRPYGWLPAMRLELPGSIAGSPTKLSRALDGVLRQFFSPAVTEPYPLFLADRMVKSLGAGVAVIEQCVAQQVASDATDIETTMLCLQNYRTQGGRGGT
jgi:hypothetical protein